MIKHFKSMSEAKDLLESVIEKYQKDIPIYSKGKSSSGINKTVTFIILAQPMEDDNFKLKDELILLKADGYPILEVSWQPKFADQMDMLLEQIEVTVEVRTYKA